MHDVVRMPPAELKELFALTAKQMSMSPRRPPRDRPLWWGEASRRAVKKVGTAFHRRPRLGGTPRPTPAWEGRAAARPLTGKAAFQAARSRCAPIENWQHWDWQHFHIGNIPSTPTAEILVYFKPLRGGIRQAGVASFGEVALSPLCLE